jgi:alkylated DNA nucleotide flippase Atl1
VVKTDWQKKARQLINDDVIPPGYLISYGRFAEIVNQKHGLNISPRNVAYLRRKLYGILGHQTSVPLHRIAKKGDVKSLFDSDRTKKENNLRRGKEGSLTDPKWV